MKLSSVFVFLAIPLAAGCASGAGAPSAGSAIPRALSVSKAAAASGTYTIIDLGTFGGNNSSASSINQIGWATGSANLAGDQYSQAALWRYGQSLPLGTLGGSNSGIDWPNHNNFGLVAGISETSQVDPLGEDWSCQAFFPTFPDTKHVCLGFVWRGHNMIPLSTLGGNNGYAAGTNDEGQIAGWAETTTADSTCTAVTKTPNSFYQVLQFEPVTWGPYGHIHRLPTLSGDPDGAATAVNDLGEVVGISGTCDQAVGRFTAAHAVIWRHGAPTNIGNFDGGIAWNTPQSINNSGEVAGFMNLPGDSNGQFQPIGFVWTASGGLTQIQPLAGDTNTLANGINDEGVVVGQSFNPNTGDVRAFIWQNGTTLDLNSFLPANSKYFLLSAADIDDAGIIVGQANVVGTSQNPAFAATPPYNWQPFKAMPSRSTANRPMLPRTLLQQLLRRYGVRMQGP